MYAAFSGRKTVGVPRSIDTGWKVPSADVINSIIKAYPEVAMMTIVSPDNPTGMVWSRDEIEMVLRIARENKLWVLFDDAYRDMRRDGTVAASDVLRDHPDDMEWSLVLASSSKEPSACGLRHGAILSKNVALIKRFTAVMAAARGSVAELSQRSVVDFLQQPRDQRNVHWKEYRQRADAVCCMLEQADIKVVHPDGGIYLMADLASVGIDDTLKFVEWLAGEFEYIDDDGMKMSVVVSPGVGFYPPGDKHAETSLIRIALVRDKETLEKAMRILLVAIEEYTKSST